jgi:hypothetical protein
MPSRDPVTAAAAQMVKESRAEMAAYIALCKAMSPEAFLAEPASHRSRLSASQQIDIINTILGNARPPRAAHAAATPPSLRKQPTFSASIRRLWKKLGPTNQAVVVGVTVALAMPFLIRIAEVTTTIAPAMSGLPGIPAL